MYNVKISYLCQKSNFLDMYTKLQYNGQKTDKITSQEQLNQELDRALDAGYDDVKKITFHRQPNGCFMGITTKLYYVRGSWQTSNY